MRYTPKDLKKLADACRKAGIKTYKDADIEFTLTEYAPVAKTRNSRKSVEEPAENTSDDSISEEDLLFWSVQGPLEGKSNENS